MARRKRVAGSAIPVYLVDGETGEVIDNSNPLQTSSSGGGGSGGDVNLTEVAGSAVSLGQKAMAASLPVVLANNQSNVPVTVATALPAGDNNVGNVDVVTLPSIPAGTNNIGDVDVLTLPALPAGNNNIGDVDVASIAAGDNNIGNVDIVTLPALPAGNNNIGDVDVLTLPALPTGTNNIGDVDVLTLPSLPAGNNNIGDVDIASIAAGDNNIGDVDVASIVPGTGATNLGKAEDAVHNSGDVGIMALGVRANTATATAPVGDYAPFLLDSNGRLHTVISAMVIGGNAGGIVSNADANSLGNGLSVASSQYLWNATAGNSDRFRNNNNITVLASAARTGTTTTAYLNYNWRGLVLFVNVTARAGSTTLTPSITVTDPIGGGNVTVWTAAAAINTASGLTAYLLYPGVIASAPTTYTEEVDLTIPRVGNIVITHSDGSSITYSVAAGYIL